MARARPIAYRPPRIDRERVRRRPPCGKQSGRRHSDQPPARAGARSEPGHLLWRRAARRRLSHRVARAQHPAEPARRADAVGLFHPGLLAAPRRRAGARRRDGSPARSSVCFWPPPPGSACSACCWPSPWWRCCRRAISPTRRGWRPARRRSTASRWPSRRCGSSSRWPACWRCRPGASGSSTATAASSCRIWRRRCGTRRSSPCCGGSAGRCSPRPAATGCPAPARDRLLIAACVGALAGGLLQFAMQLPAVFRQLRGFRLSLSTRVGGVRECLRNFAPLAASRGAVQLSGYLDQLLASFLAAGAQAALGWAFLPYFLPCQPVRPVGRRRRAAGAVAPGRGPGRGRAAPPAGRRLAADAVPDDGGHGRLSAAGVSGRGVLYRRGQFGAEDHWLVALVLAAYSIGLPASGSSRLFTNLFYALGRTRVPARIAVERVVLSALLGLALMIWLDRFAGRRPDARGAGCAAAVSRCGGAGRRLGAGGLVRAGAAVRRGAAPGRRRRAAAGVRGAAAGGALVAAARRRWRPGAGRRCRRCRRRSPPWRSTPPAIWP